MNKPKLAAAAAVFPAIKFAIKYIPHYNDSCDILSECSHFLLSIRMGANDAGIIMESSGGLIWFTSKGLKVLHNFIKMKKQSESAIKIQSVWRGYQSRKNIKFIMHPPLHTKESMANLSHLKDLSRVYDELLNDKGAEKQKEAYFLSLLNSSQTFDASEQLLGKPMDTSIQMKSSHKSGKIYMENVRKMIAWINKTQLTCYPLDSNFHYLVRSGTLLCQIIITLFPYTECHLLEKGSRYAIHKIIFFLEFCRSLGMDKSLMFSVSDLIPCLYADDTVSGLLVMTTIAALEREARIHEWTGPSINMIGLESMDSPKTLSPILELSPEINHVPHSHTHSVLNLYNDSTNAFESLKDDPGVTPSHQRFKSHSSSPSTMSENHENGNISSPSKTSKKSPKLSLFIHTPLSDDELTPDLLRRVPTNQSRFARLDSRQNNPKLQNLQILQQDHHHVSESKGLKMSPQEEVSLIQMRLAIISDLHDTEENYTHNLSKVTDFLESVIARRLKRKGSRSDTSQAYLDYEIEEISNINKIVGQMVDVHNQFLEDIENKMQQELPYFGDVLLSFVEKISKPYITYQIASSSGFEDKMISYEPEIVEFLNKVSSKFVGEFKKNHKSKKSIEWYVKRPVDKLKEYDYFLSKILKMSIQDDLIHEDDRKIRLAQIKLNALAESMQAPEILGSSNQQFKYFNMDKFMLNEE